MKEGYGMFYKNILTDINVSDAQFRIYCAISNLCAENGECRAGNKYFSELFKKTPETITRNIKELEDIGYISIRYTGNGTTNKKRFISITNGQKFDIPIDENVNVNNNILSEDNINNIDKSILLSEIKEISENFSYITAYCRKTHSIKHIRESKAIKEIMENKNLSYSSFITQIRKLAKELDEKNDRFKRLPQLDSPTGFYRNWQKVISQHNAYFKKETFKKSISEEQRRKELEDLINNF